MIAVACELRSDRAAAWHIRGQLELRLGRSTQVSFDRALALYRDAEPDDANARFQIACVHQLLGDRTTCLTELAAAIAIDPGIKQTARTDIDLVDLHDDPEYVRLLG
jgi:thioredoxin-like negative regulator of GroEL